MCAELFYLKGGFVIELVKVNKCYGEDIAAIKDINLRINDGEIFGIIGLSGAGKSTLVRYINGLEKVSSGDIFIDDKNITKLKEKDLIKMRMQIGMIFQNFSPLEQRTVFDNIKFPLELNKTNKNQAKKIVNELLELVGLSDKSKSYPSQLSGRQKQRVAIARALANTPKYLLCDEATSSIIFFKNTVSTVFFS